LLEQQGLCSEDKDALPLPLRLGWAARGRALWQWPRHGGTYHHVAYVWLLSARRYALACR
jgi:hypothetical protein